MKLDKKVIVVVGATSGVGEEISKKFVKLNYKVIGLGRNIDKLVLLENNLGGSFVGIEMDMKNEQSIQDAFFKIKNKYGQIDILINNAGIFKRDQFIDCDFNDINNIIDTNLKGIMFVTLEALKIMIDKKQSSRIINIASVASIHGIENQSVYCASKYGLSGFAEALNQELIGRYDISITTLFPGGINTPLWNQNNPYPGKNKDQILQPKDIVSAVEYISKLESRVILKNMTIFPSNEWH